MQLPFKLYLGELGVNHFLCTNAPVTQRRFNIGQIKMGKKMAGQELSIVKVYFRDEAPAFFQELQR